MADFTEIFRRSTAPPEGKSSNPTEDDGPGGGKQGSGESEPSWRAALAGAIRDPDELIRRLGLPASLATGARQAAATFPLVVPESFLARMRPGDPTDPLLRQVLPLGAETEAAPGFTSDPVDDDAATVLPGLLRKYEGRALLIATGTCAIHCRYCFRRHFPYDSTPKGLSAWQPALDALESDESIGEVLLSGGDPLVLTDTALARLLDALDAIAHLRRVRIHSRLPIVIPERVTDAFIARLRHGRLTPFVVVHANHAAELVGSCADALSRMVDAGIPVLNQAVLLRGVNDTATAVIELCERLTQLRVLPYYLHQLDPVAGAAHFHVPENRGLEILRAARARLPGYAVPRYVRETPGEVSKVPIGLL